MSKKTLVIGASDKKERYAALAIDLLQNFEHEVVGIGSRKGMVHGLEYGNEQIAFEDIDTVTLYVSPKYQTGYYQYIIDLKPKRVIFNPGTENPEFIQQLKSAGIETEIACTLVMLKTGQY